MVSDPPTNGSSTVSPASTLEPWFDAHLDLAYLAECGRSMTSDPVSAPPYPETEPHPPAGVTLPSLIAGRVGACLGTIFTEAIDAGTNAKYSTIAYPAGDAEAAHRAGVAQLARYEQWREMGLIRYLRDPIPAPATAPTRPPPPSPTGEVPSPRGGGGLRCAHPHCTPPITLGILIECADPIRSPDELAWWVERGVVAIGMAWWKSSRYAGGNGTDGGLTAMGRDLAAAMDELGVVHDLSHLSQRATDELLAVTDKPVIASHSNCRVLVDGDNARHLSDETIVEIGKRGGVIGLNLCAPFLAQTGDAGGPGGGEKGVHATINDCVRHVEHVCALQGTRSGVGLGSDMDGGFSTDHLPAGIRCPSNLDLITDALQANGWTTTDLNGFRQGNWSRFFGVDIAAQ